MYQIPVDAHIKDTCLLISQLTCLLQTSRGLHKAGGMQNSQEDLLLLISHWKMQSSSCQHLPAYYLSLQDGSMGRVKNWCSETMNSLHPVCGWPWVKVITEHWPCLAHRGRLQWTNDGDQALKTCIVLGRNVFWVPKLDARHVSVLSMGLSFGFGSVLGPSWYTPSTLTGNPFGKNWELAAHLALGFWFHPNPGFRDL